MIQDTIKSIFLDNGTINEHLKFQTENYYDYVSVLLSLFKLNIDITSLTKAKVLAVALHRNDKELLYRLLPMEQFGLAEILKTCKIIDAKRMVNNLNKKINKIKLQSAKRNIIEPTKTEKKINRELMAVEKFYTDLDFTSNLSGAKAKFLRKNWVQKISKEKLEIDAMMLPTSYWKELADFLHIKKTDFQLDWFQDFVFGKPAPDNSILATCKKITDKNALEILMTYKPAYQYIRSINKKQQLFKMTNEVKKVIVSYLSLDVVIWYWEELSTKEVDTIIINRLNTEKLSLTYGKLMERLMVMKAARAFDIYDKLLTIAEEKMKGYTLDLEKPIVVLGDASASMEVAIKTSIIMASMLRAIADAEIRMFRDTDELIKDPPKSVKDIITFGMSYKADRATAPAASLLPYYNDKKVVKTFIIVTDEEENTPAINGQMFTELYKCYRETVHPAKLVFISFTPNDKDGQMISFLKAAIPGVEKDIIKFRMDNKRPDLAKLDLILGKLAINTDSFNENAKKMATEMESRKFIDEDFVIV